MPVRCATCSEDFLGAVNRCWKCGAYVTLNLDAFQTPPVRRSPVSLRPKASAAKPATEGGQVAVAEFADERPTAATAGRASTQGGVRRRGNPFANEASHAVFVPATSEAMANADAAEKGVWIGLAVGLLAWLLAFFFPPAALIVALVAVGLAIWGLSSRKKALAGAVIVLCVTGFLVGGYQSVKWVYDRISPQFQTQELEEDSQ